jgi:uncharacterized MAPEG superfamily protein
MARETYRYRTLVSKKWVSGTRDRRGIVTLAYWMVLAAAVLPYVGTAYAKFADGGGKTYDNGAPREQMDKLPPKRRRAHWAQLNGFEAFPPFAAAVIIARLCGASQAWIDLLACVFVTARIVYTGCYIYNRPTARSIVWAVGFLCVIAMFLAAAGATASIAT